MKSCNNYNYFNQFWTILGKTRNKNVQITDKIDYFILLIEVANGKELFLLVVDDAFI